MADWVGQLITGAVGVAGLGSALVVGWQTRKHAEKMAEGAAAMNMRQNLVNKRHDSYVRILQIGFAVQQWSVLMDRVLMEGRIEETPSIDGNAWAEANSLAAAFSSKPIAEAFKVWTDAIMECRKRAKAVLLRYQTIAEHGSSPGKQPEDLYDHFKKSANHADDAYKVLANKINVELTRPD